MCTIGLVWKPRVIREDTCVYHWLDVEAWIYQGGYMCVPLAWCGSLDLSGRIYMCTIGLMSKLGFIREDTCVYNWLDVEAWIYLEGYMYVPLVWCGSLELSGRIHVCTIGLVWKPGVIREDTCVYHWLGVEAWIYQGGYMCVPLVWCGSLELSGRIHVCAIGLVWKPGFIREDTCVYDWLGVEAWNDHRGYMCVPLAWCGRMD